MRLIHSHRPIERASRSELKGMNMLTLAGVFFILAMLAAFIDYCLDCVDIDSTWVVRALLLASAVMIGLNTWVARG
jgi:hypothetical protein